MKKGHEKFEKVMHEFKEGSLHSGSKKGPKVKSAAQAKAIAFSEDRKADKTAKGMHDADHHHKAIKHHMAALHKMAKAHHKGK
jgi:hypothetical protein